jgi:hypothetical protein
MHARVTTFHTEPSKADAIVGVLSDAIAELEAIDGFTGIRALLDRSTGKAFAVTYWASPEQMQASSEAIAPLRDRMLAAAGGELESVDACDLIFDRMGARAHA